MLRCFTAGNDTEMITIGRFAKKRKKKNFSQITVWVQIQPNSNQSIILPT